ncbi:DNA repair protein rad16 [Grifola frondosa]|uniref:DNA repair protein rad16 n=1 Tax=Grifola frondosa TaxID=5627 RepID=A0A1C7MM48_GRIFR|nr:DNA repair protein rad16 [Grifola frondosa]
MSTLLSFHQTILEKIHDPATSELLLLARGLGLRRIVCKLLQIYDSPNSLVLLVNASQEEEAAIGEELGIMGCRRPGLRIVGFETGRKDRQDLYKKGGLISITSQIFTVDMLSSEIPTHLITGILVLHAERVTPTSAEAFIVRLYREKNKTGFLKAFSDQPEYITSGMSPLRTIMKELQLRTVHIYPRFHAEVKESLDRKQPDLIELHQDMTESMAEIHHAIVQCMTTTLSELKRANTMANLDDLSIDNAYFRSFDMIVRRILDPVWHKVGPRTKQLVSDLATLRRLLSYLLTYDALAFHAYLETLIASNTYTDSGAARQHQSPWLLTDAANIIFQYAKRRCYTMSSTSQKAPAPPTVIDLVDDEDAWDVVNEMEGRPAGQASTPRQMRQKWLPDGMDPELEELPKWYLLADVLHEIEQEMMRLESHLTSLSPGKNTVLIMASSLHTCTLLSEFLSSMDLHAPRGSQGRKMMEDKLRLYLWWKDDAVQVSEALQKKDREKRERAASRRRVRGGAPAALCEGHDRWKRARGSGEIVIKDEADDIAFFLSTQNGDTFEGPSGIEQGIPEFDTGFDANYVLQEIQPRFIVMFEPNLEFIRRIEVYRNSNPGLGVRVFHALQTELRRGEYLTGLRREKESFERLIKERGVIVDMREFRSSLPSLLHASRLLVIPTTLTVGDYILTPDICVERKSIPDLVSSFNSGRLYTRAQVVLARGTHSTPALPSQYDLTCFQAVADVKSYAKPSNKYPSKSRPPARASTTAAQSIQAKLVLLTLSFPRVRIIWSSSPFATAEIFNDLKAGAPEPDPAKAVLVGAEEDPERRLRRECRGGGAPARAAGRHRNEREARRGQGAERPRVVHAGAPAGARDSRRGAREGMLGVPASWRAKAVTQRSVSGAGHSLSDI